MRKIFYLFPPLVRAYHFTLAFLGALVYGFPSRKLIVIGVTGTKGKTTVCNLIADVFNSAGYKAGTATTVNFKIGQKELVNATKQTMLGRFQLQKLLARMVKEGCRYAVIETSSEGIAQYRHRFIDYGAAVFTNLSPEHIERHGSFDNYRAAKVKLFEKVAKKKNGAGVYNLDDENAEYFLKPAIKNKFGYGFKKFSASAGGQFSNKFQISGVRLSRKGAKFSFGGEKIEIPLLGEFNVYNAAAAICAALSQGVPMIEIKEALKKVKPVPGRMEVLDSGKGFKVVIDYAHEPLSLESLYTAVEKVFKPRKIIGVFGAQGGGRDKWKRKEMGRIAAKHCDIIILTNEDPYDENPLQIINDIESGFALGSRFKVQGSRFYKIVSRKEAIEKAISLAGKGDAAVVSGKGGEVWMCVERDRKVSWNDKETVLEILRRV